MIPADLKVALKLLVETEYLGDWVYDVRSRAGDEDDGFEGNSWDHPRVKAFSDAVTVVEHYAKD